MTLKHFKKIYVEITNVCNLHCTFCSENKRNSGFMPVSLFTEVIKKIHIHTNYIYLHVKGEPLLHPNLSEILDFCNEYKLYVVLVTNGTLIREKGDILLTKPALKQINISLHCITELQAYTNKKDYINSIISFTKQVIAQSNITISLRLWNIEKEKLNNHADNQEILKSIEHEFAPDSNLIQMVIPGKGLKLHERLYINSDFEFSWPSIDSPYDNPNGFCYGLRDQLAVLFDGTIVPCCLDADGIINLGNIQENEIQQIITSDRAQKIFNGFSNAKRVEPLCQKCQFINKIN